MGEAEININLRCSNGDKFSVSSSVRTRVVNFKDLLAQNCVAPANEQKLIHKGIILKDGRTLNSYGVQADHTIHVVHDPLLPIIKDIVDRNPQLAKFSMLLTDPQMHDIIVPSDIMKLIREATRDFKLTNEIYEYMYENIQEPFLNATTTCGGAATQTPSATHTETAPGFAAPNSNPLPSATAVPPEQLYETQLSRLQEMGFLDTQENIRALGTLCASGGNAAVERLLGKGNFGP